MSATARDRCSGLSCAARSRAALPACEVALRTASRRKAKRELCVLPHVLQLYLAGFASNLGRGQARSISQCGGGHGLGLVGRGRGCAPASPPMSEKLRADNKRRRRWRRRTPTWRKRLLDPPQKKQQAAGAKPVIITTTTINNNNNNNQNTQIALLHFPSRAM